MIVITSDSSLGDEGERAAVHSKNTHCFVSSGEEGLDGESTQLKRNFNGGYWPKWSTLEETSPSGEEPSAYVTDSRQLWFKGLLYEGEWRLRVWLRQVGEE